MTKKFQMEVACFDSVGMLFHNFPPPLRNIFGYFMFCPSVDRCFSGAEAMIGAKIYSSEQVTEILSRNLKTIAPCSRLPSIRVLTRGLHLDRLDESSA